MLLVFFNKTEQTSNEKAKSTTTTGRIYTKMLSPTNNDKPTITTTTSKSLCCLIYS